MQMRWERATKVVVAAVLLLTFVAMFEVDAAAPVSPERRLADNILQEIYIEEQRAAAKAAAANRKGTLTSVKCPLQGRCDATFTRDTAESAAKKQQ